MVTLTIVSIIVFICINKSSMLYRNCNSCLEPAEQEV